jgi:MFS family permease
MASEMLYPVMPVYLRSIGFSMLIIGILEGIAEATAGLSKGYFGKFSDVTGKRTIFVQAGYGLSALSKPLMAAFIFPLWIFFARTVDRLGKGLRTGARDAMLSDESTKENKARVFGFHRSMDTIGAVIGPILALLFLHYHPDQYRSLFLWALIPGIIATLCTLLLKEKKSEKPKQQTPVPFFSFLSYWTTSPPAYRRLTLGLLTFTLFNSSDVFLLLQLKQMGLSDTLVITMYIFYNLIYALSAYPAGILADKIGLRMVFISGLILFILVYTGMAFAGNLYLYFILFFIYGIYASTTEGISKAWISLISDKKDTATAIGTYSGLQSICTMLASSLTGYIWYQFGASTAFITTAIATTLVVIYFIIVWIPVESQYRS